MSSANGGQPVRASTSNLDKNFAFYYIILVMCSIFIGISFGLAANGNDLEWFDWLAFISMIFVWIIVWKSMKNDEKMVKIGEKLKKMEEKQQKK